MLAAMDEAIGQIIAAIDESGMRKNTLILFSSDNGGPQPGKVTSNGNLRRQSDTLRRWSSRRGLRELGQESSERGRWSMSRCTLSICIQPC